METYFESFFFVGPRGPQGRPTILDDQQFWKIAFDKRDVLALLLTLFAKMKQNIGSNILFGATICKLDAFEIYCEKYGHNMAKDAHLEIMA